MHIGIDVRPMQGASGNRGIRKVVGNLLDALTKSGSEHTYSLLTFLAALPERLQNLPDNFRIVTLDCAPFVSVSPLYRMPKGWMLHHLLCQQDQSRALQAVIRREQFDLLHVTSVHDSAYYLPNRYECPTLMTLYDMIPLVMRETYEALMTREAWWQYRRQCQSYSSADLVVAISESARQDALRFLDLSPDRLVTVPLGLSDEFNEPATPIQCTAARHKYGIEKPYFLFCSGEGPNKNCDRILNAYADFHMQQPSHQLVWVGPHQSDFIGYVRGLAKQRGLTEQDFIVTGFVSDVDLVALQTDAVALLSPSLYEGFGLPAAQSMRLGTPVIGANNSSYPEVVGDAGLLVDPMNREEIAAAMHRISGDSNLRESLAERGRMRAKRYDNQQNARTMLVLFQQLAQGNRDFVRFTEPIAYETQRAS